MDPDGETASFRKRSWSRSRTLPEHVAPTAEGSIDDQMVDAGSYVMVDVSDVTSPTLTCDTLTYTAESDMMDYATV